MLQNRFRPVTLGSVRMISVTGSSSSLTRLSKWLLRSSPDHGEEKLDPWWKVMCLTGVDYFSSMGFQPGISFLAAGLLSPFATLSLVLLTLFGALPAYRVIAEESPHGQGSFHIFETVLKGWAGKTCVLILLGFAVTDFVFTITMCASDASAHIVENPWFPHFQFDRIILTIGMILILGGVFLKGFGEAVRISVWLVAAYLLVNLVTLTVCVQKLLLHQDLITLWINNLFAQYKSVATMSGVCLMVFPQLALGLSGFETGVAVMPMIKTREKDSLPQRVELTRRLLITVAAIMAVFLMVGSTVTTLLIDPKLFAEGGEANGRALAYLAHLYLGDTFGLIYDASTVLILWFAGASGVAALLSLVPQYLPRYGMAPGWARARKPLVLIVTAISVFIVILFRANVDAQAGAFATGLLVLIASATVAATITVFNRGIVQRVSFCLISLAFIYASIMIITTRPDGFFISVAFTALMLFSCLLSRAMRSTELRIGKVELDEEAASFIKKAANEAWGEIRLLAHKPDDSSYAWKIQDARFRHSIQEAEGNFIFLEVIPKDVSEFYTGVLKVRGLESHGYPILRCHSPTVPNAIAALLLELRDTTGKMPHAYFGWTEGNPVSYAFKYLIFGEGETAPLTREILRNAEPSVEKRPQIHVA